MEDGRVEGEEPQVWGKVGGEPRLREKKAAQERTTHFIDILKYLRLPCPADVGDEPKQAMQASGV